ncbi:hypothetical protein KKA14_13180 [bacterium]|nr:hypothetical protein [bacterium]
MILRSTSTSLIGLFISCSTNLLGAITILVLVLSHTTGYAQVSGLTLRSPPMTHAMLDSSDFLVGIGLSQTHVTNLPYQVSNVQVESALTTENFAFLAYGVSENIALGISANPTQIKVKGVVSGTSETVDTEIISSKSYYYIIPTLARWDANRIAFIWGKGNATFADNSKLNMEASSQEIGTTGLVAEVYLGQSFSTVLWASWPYLLIDFPSFRVADVQTPDYGLDGVLHLGDVRITLTMVFQALDTVGVSTDEDEEEPTKSTSSEDSSQESFAISFSYVF